ncbi:MAG: SRPBCC family protein [Myxococcota bacterium]
MKIYEHIVVDASVSDLWKVLGERFADVSDWTESVTESYLDGPLTAGAVRTCHLKPTGPLAGGIVTEELTHFMPASHSLTYQVRSGLPGFIGHLTNAWSIQELSGRRARVQSVITLRVAWWMTPLALLVKMQMRRAIRGFLKELEDFVAAPESVSELQAHAG